MKRQKPLRKISPRRRLVLAELNRVVKIWWDALVRNAAPYVPVCDWPGCKRPAGKRPHHLIPRSVRPDLICEPLNFAGTCQKHHDYAHSHPAEAYKIGFMGRSTDKLSDLWERLLRAQKEAK
jgi:hypothetical protein